MIDIFHDVSLACSKTTTEKYSTSFSSAIKLLHKDFRTPVFNIYGFVRFADEIVDTFHSYNKQELLKEFKESTYLAIERGISLNPILHSFQMTVREYGIQKELIDAFFHSMELDLNKSVYDSKEYKEYIYGSAEVVGLMCLHVFCEANLEKYNQLKTYARSLGAAFQKINFLRDASADFHQLNRTYFPEVDLRNFNDAVKRQIENDIMLDFSNAYKGIMLLPIKARFGVYVAYKYYYSLFNKIRNIQSRKIMQQRVRIPNYGKLLIIAKAGLRSQLNLI